MKAPQLAAGIFTFDDQERALLIEGSSRKRLWSNMFNAIGGHIERGEDIFDAAYRELEEETGIKEILLQFCGQIMIDVRDDLGVALFLFRGIYLEGRLTPSPEGSLFWKHIDALNEIKLVEDLTYLLPSVYEYNTGDPLIVGKYHYDQKGNLIVNFR
ncbi:MAG: NUDIX domain-containing protein [Chloroflexota bacterium]|nr:NUDIX domain-containing protein [Chloroflexota bacterium]